MWRRKGGRRRYDKQMLQAIGNDTLQTEYCSTLKVFCSVLKTKDYIYAIEIKLDGSADEALKQIESKGYAELFAKDGRKLYRIGVNFSSEKRGIGEWKIADN